MPEPFKNAFNAAVVKSLAFHIKQQYPEFQDRLFCEVVLSNLHQLELKQRSQSITAHLDTYLPDDFEIFKTILLAILHPEHSAEMKENNIDNRGVRGWMVMPLADLAAKRALPDFFAVGMQLMKALTCRFSAEFAIRDFIINQQSAALELMQQWTLDESEHIRRLASEGARPRLPWGIQLKNLISDPKPLTPILMSLIDDESEYVRRSVANNLNDISKDHPDYVIKFVEKYLQGASENRFRLLKHASRSLFKQGNEDILRLFGYGHFEGKVKVELSSGSVHLGEDIWINAEIRGLTESKQNIMLDYVVWHTKADGKLSSKVFKWKNCELASGKTLALKKKHSLKPVTTRKYYAGEHKIQLQINGKVYCEERFELQI